MFFVKYIFDCVGEDVNRAIEFNQLKPYRNILVIFLNMTDHFYDIWKNQSF